MLFSLEGFSQVAHWFVKVGEGTVQGYCSMLRILKVLYGFCFRMFRWCIVSDVEVVHGVIDFKTLQFPKWWKVFCSTNSNKRNLWQQQESQVAVFHIEEYDSTCQFCAKCFTWSFSAVWTIVLLWNVKLKSYC